MADLFEDYRLGPGWDEMFATAGMPRETYESLHATLQPLSSADLGVRADVLARAFLDQGITFALKGVERPFPLDIVPRIIDGRRVGGGGSRCRATGPGAGGVPRRRLRRRRGARRRRRAAAVVVTSAHFHREAAGIVPPNGVRVHVAGVDLVRDEAGAFRVLEDNVRVPSGVSYVMENRRAMSHVLPEVFAATRIRPVESYPSQLLRRAAGRGAGRGDRRPDRGGAHPGRVQLGLLRARAAGPGDGRRAGRGARPDLRRQPGRACAPPPASSRST